MSISRIYRLLQMITMLQGNRNFTADELAQELEVSRRTIFRDLNMLEMARIPYYFDPDRGGYRISRHFFLPPINLTLTEALSMLLLTGRMKGATRLPLLSQGAKAAMKLESALPKSIRRHIGSIIDRMHVSLGPLSRHDQLDATFDELSAAIVDKHICKMIYISFHERKQITFTIHPLRLAFIGRAWYLLAYAARYREVRTFKLGRVRKLTVTDRTFDQPIDVDLDEHFGQAWRMIPEGRLYDVHLHFGSKVAGNIAEVQWHESQRIEWNDDGSIEFYVTVDGLGEILWWLLGYGDQVQVRSPDALAERVAETARKMLAKHSKKGSRR